MAESLTSTSPQASLLNLASASEDAALKLAMELSASLSSPSTTSYSTCKDSGVTNSNAVTTKRYPIALPESIQRYEKQKQRKETKNASTPVVTTKKKKAEEDDDDLH
eukprot:12045842-Ditylum_brightwellii.AAC.1